MAGKVLNYGSLNIDLVYTVPHIVRPGETLTSLNYARFPGGKGLNQSIALKRAGAETCHAGSIGEDGRFLAELLQADGVDVSRVAVLDAPTGHALIQVEEGGQNCIVLFPGTNRMNAAQAPDALLNGFGAGDFLLLQNEVDGNAAVMEEAKKRGMKIALNPSPMDEDALRLPLSLVDLFLVNEVEGADLTGEEAPEKILDAMAEKYPDAAVVLTLGSRGSMYADGKVRLSQPIFPCEVVDTTAAGDTFTGYVLNGLLAGEAPEVFMRRATMASSIAVSRAGAAPSIPYRKEVEEALGRL
ncbi:MAG: ribokinase [Lachnospiraceae bacterium]|nr:ribokinase [Lachnospiraceae bacterium]